jgi:hypothetical protein
MEIASHAPEVWPSSIRGINNLPLAEKHAIYRCLIAPWVLERFHIEPDTLTQHGQDVVHINAPANSRAMEMSIWHKPGALDPVMYINMVDTFNNQLMVLLVVINDPESPRFAIDQDLNGVPTHLGTRGRNIPAELAAMQAGLAPGQIRAGLRGSRKLVPVFERFIQTMGHTMFLIEPFAYHNAITFERYGFSYLYGKQEMIRIHEAFLPGGDLCRKLDGSTPFRSPEAFRTVRGRSWAIHDGLLGHPFTGFQMYKRVGIEAQVNTFPDSVW